MLGFVQLTQLIFGQHHARNIHFSATDMTMHINRASHHYFAC
jgi:hypothetical protein